MSVTESLHYANGGDRYQNSWVYEFGNCYVGGDLIDTPVGTNTYIPSLYLQKPARTLPNPRLNISPPSYPQCITTTNAYPPQLVNLEKTHNYYSEIQTSISHHYSPPASVHHSTSR